MFHVAVRFLAVELKRLQAVILSMKLFMSISAELVLVIGNYHTIGQCVASKKEPNISQLTQCYQ